LTFLNGTKFEANFLGGEKNDFGVTSINKLETYTIAVLREHSPHPIMGISHFLIIIMILATEKSVFFSILNF
jgi:hypothetical protein